MSKDIIRHTIKHRPNVLIHLSAMIPFETRHEKTYHADSRYVNGSGSHEQSRSTNKLSVSYLIYLYLRLIAASEQHHTIDGIPKKYLNERQI